MSGEGGGGGGTRRDTWGECCCHNPKSTNCMSTYSSKRGEMDRTGEEEEKGVPEEIYGERHRRKSAKCMLHVLDRDSQGTEN